MQTGNTRSIFTKLLINNFIASVTNAFVWFAVTFWVFLETKSILATSLIAGIFAVSNALTGLFFGAIVDHHKKKLVMIGSSILSLGAYSLASALYFTQPTATFAIPSSLILWIFITILMAGTIAGNLRNIALSTCVTMLFTEEERPKANGRIGTINGISFACTSLVSGLVIGYAGMDVALGIAVTITLLSILHLLPIALTEKEIATNNTSTAEKIDFKGTLRTVKSIPGLLPLIFFTTFNNFIGGIFMALMDSYGLSLVSVQTWGILWSGLSLLFIVSGLLIAKFGLGKNPVNTLFTLNMLTWFSCIFFTIQPSVILLLIGAGIWMLCGPAIEASEHTIIQKVIPYERLGRVMGFAQSIESAASPLTTFLIGPLTHFLVVPFMTNGLGAEVIGSWFGTGQARAIALVFTISGVIGTTTTFFARRSKSARLLSGCYTATNQVAQ